MAGWIDHPEHGRVWDDGGVVVVDDLADVDDLILSLLADGEEYAASCTWDHWVSHVSREMRKKRRSSAIREAELEGWHDHTDNLRSMSH